MIANFIPTFSIALYFLGSLFLENSFLALVPIFHWGVYRIDLVPVSVVFMFALSFDALFYMYLGPTLTLYLLSLASIYAMRKFLITQHFVFVWPGLALLGVYYLVLQITLNALSILPFRAMDSYIVLLLVIAYPVVVRPLIYCHQRFLANE